MRELPVNSTKFDGSIHYQFLTRELRRGERELVTYHTPGTPVRSYRGEYTGIMHMLSFFWTDKHYNLHVCWFSDWRPRSLYVNVATPATWHDNVIRYVDLDLDLIVRPGNDEPHIDDEDEFTAHGKLWGYPPDLIARCRASVEEGKRLFAAKNWPFTDELFSWRPGMPLLRSSFDAANADNG